MNTVSSLAPWTAADSRALTPRDRAGITDYLQASVAAGDLEYAEESFADQYRRGLRAATVKIPLPTRAEAVLYAIETFGADAARAVAFAEVAVGGEMTENAWRLVLCAPSAFVMVKRAA